jgi:ribosomal protein S17E
MDTVAHISTKNSKRIKNQLYSKYQTVRADDNHGVNSLAAPLFEAYVDERVREFNRNQSG